MWLDVRGIKCGEVNFCWGTLVAAAIETGGEWVRYRRALVM